MWPALALMPAATAATPPSINQVNIKPSNVEQKLTEEETLTGSTGTHISHVLDEVETELL